MKQAKYKKGQYVSYKYNLGTRSSYKILRAFVMDGSYWYELDHVAYSICEEDIYTV